MTFLTKMGAVHAALFMISLLPVTVTAQAVRTQRKPAEMVAAFASESSGGARRQASSQITQTLTHPGPRPQADMDALLDGLEDLSVHSKSPTVRREAAFLISIPGSRRSKTPSARTFERLQRVYRKSSDYTVKSVVVGVMGDLTDRGKPAAFLKTVAVEDSTGVLAEVAVSALLTLGDEGRAVLRQLHDSNEVPDSEVRQILSTMAKNGYRLP